MKFSIVAVASVVTVASAFTAPKSSFMGKTSVVQAANGGNGSNLDMKYTVAVVGGGPSGACAAEVFAQESGIDTVMFERKMDNAKPCGGAIPLCMIGEFNIPESVVDRKVRGKSVSLNSLNRCGSTREIALEIAGYLGVERSDVISLQ